MNKDFLLSSYDFDLPQSQIAQHPSEKRDKSRLLVLNRTTSSILHQKFSDIINFLEPGDLLIINKTKVFPARLLGKKETGGKIELFLLSLPERKAEGLYYAEALCRCSKGPKVGQKVYFRENGELEVKIIGIRHGGGVKLELSCKIDILKALKKTGSVPLPPYIKRHPEADDIERYQTVYASEPGSVAAPTAGLHFSQDLIKRIKDKGVLLAPVTLHVGYGTFAPVRTEDIREHKIHSEWIRIENNTVNLIKETKKRGNKVICVGTTSVRTVEFAYKRRGTLEPYSGPCDLFIYPGFKFQVTDAIVTNFHLPKSSLLLLVSAFAGRQTILNAYKEAISKGYRFFSYGDAMLIL